MKQATSKTSYHLIAAILFAIMAVGTLQNLQNLLAIFIAENMVSIALSLTLATLVAEVIIAGTLFRGKHGKGVAIAFTLLAACALVQFFLGFPRGYYNVEDFHVYSDNEISFHLLCLLPWLAYFASYWGIAFAAHTEFTNRFSKYRAVVRKYWFLPGALCAASVVLVLLVQFLLRVSGAGTWYSFGSFISLGGLFHRLLLAAGLLCTSLWMAYPDGLPDVEDSGAQAGSGCCGIIKLLLLSFFTLGIYYYIWVYRTTGYLNRVENEPKQRAGSQVLAVMFMFLLRYDIYWTYKNAQRIDALAHQTGIQSNVAIICLALAPLLPMISGALMQDRINTIAQIEAGILAPPSAPIAAPTAVSTPYARANDNPDDLPEL